MNRTRATNILLEQGSDLCFSPENELSASRVDSFPYFAKLTVGVVCMLLAFVGIAVLIYAAILLFGCNGFFSVLRHEHVDMKQPVRTWKDSEVKEKRRTLIMPALVSRLPSRCPLQSPSWGACSRTSAISPCCTSSSPRRVF